ncbi:MAG: methylenetetrahydrofolate--tRNA-(uracil(54)-C(5))-methyltransferase (FADH(2)-oxidizing) TrmFO [Deltaproteobacteria bacterium]|jgi:methylenetetrahydrofolate--tRNA-(uracil-5-)-methyltransferase|nr:methylenetetrahydrofolate--tRNA-(uracil(54)-C(5))-methyltransferase (FADH(2)-oxidizing) TrmFO [Deltaproteobacteria bacterium]
MGSPDSNAPLHIIGGGLAGCEAAWRAAAHRVPAIIWEMKPLNFSPAHQNPDLAELVCSNSLRSSDPQNAVGLLKEELRNLGSIVMEAADLTQVPAGKALAVDREKFSREITRRIESSPYLTVKRKESADLSPPDGAVAVVAAGPLASARLTEELQKLTGAANLSFYDALAPIVTRESLDLDRLFLANRYGEGEGDYLNAPFEKDEFLKFYEALQREDALSPRPFEDPRFFEGCLPIEVMAARGQRVLTFGPMKPVGLTDPRSGRRPYAVAQLRRENLQGSLWNIVGFQTRLPRGAQERVFRLIPGLARASFARYGAIHRNTYLEAPQVLDPYQRLLARPSVFMAGQISGVEGYVESAAQGLVAGENAARAVKGLPLVIPPRETALGALLGHLLPRKGPFSPSNVNFGLFPAPPPETPRAQVHAWRVAEARRRLGLFLKEIDYVYPR